MLDNEKILDRMNSSKKLLWFFYIVLFAFMVLCNVMTIKVADDFAYLYSWADGSRITNPLQIIPSMAAHAKRMNGRLIAHGVAQFWLMLPDWMFDIANSLVFILQIPLIVLISKGKGDRQNNLLHMGILGAMWIFELVFGEVNLWLDGACNYLWSVVAGLLFIIPYVRHFMSDESHSMKMPKIVFLLLAIAMGGWVESASAAFIFIAAVLLVLGYFWQRKPMPRILLVGIVLAAMAYVTIYMAPAQMNKGTEMSVLSLVKGLVRCILGVCDIWVLVAAFAVLLYLNICNGTDRKRLVLAGVFFVGAMCGNLIFMFAAFYPGRAVIGMTMILICADAILLQGLLAQGNYRTAAASILLVLIVTAPVIMLRGAKDIYDTYAAMKKNEAYIYECAENGVKDVVVPLIKPGTKYSAALELRYLMEDPNDWPNGDMALYYGVDSLAGVEP